MLFRSPRPSEDNSKLFSPLSPRSDVASPEGAASRPSGEQGPSRPLMGRSSTQFSRHVPQHPLSQVHRKEQRKSSFSWGDSHGQLMNDNDDLEGDLGYAAAEDMEHNQRKVIVERLETVKSKNPVFTWC